MAELAHGIETMKALHAQGVRVLIGGDYGFACNRVGTDAREIGHFVEILKFSPMDAILAAMRLDGETGGWASALARAAGVFSPICC